MNFLYCFDENYNIPASVSIFSLLENVKEEINVYIIHKNKKTFEPLDAITSHRNLNKLEIYEFSNKNYEFPNIEGAHVSEATYYRFFIEMHLPKDLKFITYVDADIVFVSDPVNEINEEIKKLEDSSNLISVRSESEILNEKLNLKSNKYFNAGVMIINFNKWLESDILNKLLNLTDERAEDIQWWDQDVLNIYFDGNYTEMSENLNYRLEMFPYQKKVVHKLDKNIKVIHYSGKFKPWSLKGIENNLSIYYQEIYRSLYSNRYHLSDNWKINTLRDLIKIISTGRLFKIRYPFSLIVTVIRFLITDRKNV